ncbi:MAG: hypothetical protein WBQ60_12940 [Asticcacaulis sp.]
MKIPSLFTRLAALAAAAGLIVGLSLSAQTATAAETAPFTIDPAVKAKSMVDIVPLIPLAKINCEPTDAYLLGPVAAEGTAPAAQLYEVACKTGPGYIITKISDTQVGKTFTCSLAATLHTQKATSPLCILPENTPHYAWLNAQIKPFMPDCTVDKARLIGSTTEEPFLDRYEVSCTTGTGGVVDYPQIGSTAPVDFKNCVIVAGSNSACTFITEEQMRAPLKPVAAKASATCQVNNARFLGVSKDNANLYYEIGCANEVGFVVVTDNKTNYERTIACTSAASLGGCTFTDMGAAAADANTNYSTQLTKAGYPCKVEDYTVLGTQEGTKRDYIEFKCADRPWGLIGFVPQVGSTSSLRVNDCFIDQSGRKDCTFVKESDLRAQLDKLIKIKEPAKNCDVSDVRYIGESDGIEGALVAELACANKRGYIVVVSADRNSIAESTACVLAKSHNDPVQCTIPNNGTYSSTE